MVAIINDKLGAALTKDLDIADIKHLDLDGFRFAGRVNITAWLEDADRYIGFLKGKGDVAEYFKEFLGCDTTIQDKEDTKKAYSHPGAICRPRERRCEGQTGVLAKGFRNL